jgi:hypothetical protein
MARRLKTRKKGKTGAQDLTGNPDFRTRSTFPLPPGEELEQRLRAVLTPGLFAARRGDKAVGKWRDRLLTLPVRAVLVVSLVWRQIPSLSEALRVGAREGLGDCAPFTVRRPALSQRLRALPAQLLAQLSDEALGRLRATRTREPPAVGSLPARCSALWAADGSTLEALRRKLTDLRESTTPRGGKLLAVVELFTRCPQHTWSTTHAQANDKSFCQQLLAALPGGGLVVLDLGWFSFSFFAALTTAGQYFGTRRRAKTAYPVGERLGAGPPWREELLALGGYRANPCRQRVRRVSVLWGTTW